MPELQRTENRVHGVTTDVAESAGAKIPPTTPLERQIGRVVRAGWGWAEPQIPIQLRRHGSGISRTFDALRPVLLEQSLRGPVGPDMGFVNLADRTVLDK